MKIACLCTYPARSETIYPVIDSMINQVDRIYVCLNEFSEIPKKLKRYRNVVPYIPECDYRDVGKFVRSDFSDEDYIFYIDDDIVYPVDYVEKMIHWLDKYSSVDAVVGLHGVIYSDVFLGSVANRKVFSFTKALSEAREVNQLGTGTVCCRGYQAAPLSFMDGSQKFVDVRFARFCKGNSWPMVCVSREAGWLVEMENDETIFNSFTKVWPSSVIKETQSIAGYSKLNVNVSSLLAE